VRIRSCAFALAAALLATVTEPAAADDAAGLLAKHRAFVGWQYDDGGLKSFKLDGERTLGSQRLAGDAAVYVGTRYRRTLIRGDRSTAEGYDGTRFWVANENGFVVPRAGDAVRASISYTDVVLERLGGLRGRVVGMQILDGAPTSIVANAPVADTELAPPVGGARWTFGTAAPLPIDVAQERIYVHATVNGVKGKFIFDTGANTIVVSDSFLRRAGATQLDRVAALSFGGRFTANVFRVEDIDFGAGNRLRNVIVESGLDEEGFGKEGVDGLLGFDFLAGAMVDVDLDAKVMHIYDPVTNGPNRSAGFNVAIDAGDGTPRVRMRVDSRVYVLAVLDTGEPAHVFVSDGLIRNDRVPFFADPTDPQSRRRVYGTSGRAERLICGTLDRLRLGPIEYRPVPACRSPYLAHRQIVVGYDFVRNFNVLFDYSDALLVMTPRTNAQRDLPVKK
jgi:hypothetical protein